MYVRLDMGLSGLFLLAFTLLTKAVFAGNVLILIDLPSYSHQTFNYAIGQALMEKGHNITMAIPNNFIGKKSDKYHPIIFEGIEKLVNTIQASIMKEDFSKIKTLWLIKKFGDYVLRVCQSLYSSQGFQILLNYPDTFKFDLIIIDMTLGSCLYPFIQKFKYPPTVGTTAFLLPPFLSPVFGNNVQTSYLPFYQLKYSENMNFYQRVNNYVFTKLESISKQSYERYRIATLAKVAFGENLVSMDVLERHISLLLCNINLAFHLPQPLTPNIIPVGGLHIRPPKKLPKDLQMIMDNAQDGVILFSLGTNIRTDKLSVQMRDIFLKAFEQLKQIVIWKYESPLKDVPKNVVVRPFLPQRDIFEHPNLRLFINHGGALSSLEATYFGVPVIGMPFFVDQDVTVNLIVDRKLGIKMSRLDLTTEKVLWSVNEILNNSIYSQNMKNLSKRMQDQLTTPLETAVFWTEYAMRHNGTHFFNPKSRDMSFFVSSSTDVILFLLLITSLFVYIFLTACKKTILLIRVSILKSKSKRKMN